MKARGSSAAVLPPATRAKRRSIVELTGRKTHRAAMLEPIRLKRILVPTDCSAASIKALNYAVRFAEASGATIMLVYVIQPPTCLPDLENIPLALPEAELEAAARQKLLSLASAEIEELVPVQTRVCFGKPYREIVRVAQESASDLIIISTHGHTGVERVLFGSTAEKVVRHAPCPVLVVRGHEREFIY